MCRNNEQETTSKWETWSRDTNSRLPFDVNVMLHLSNNAWGQSVVEFQAIYSKSGDT